MNFYPYLQEKDFQDCWNFIEVVNVSIFCVFWCGNLEALMSKA